MQENNPEPRVVIAYPPSDWWCIDN